MASKACIEERRFTITVDCTDVSTMLQKHLGATFIALFAGIVQRCLFVQRHPFVYNSQLTDSTNIGTMLKQ